MPRLNFDFSFRATSLVTGTATGIHTSGVLTSPLYAYSETPVQAIANNLVSLGSFNRIGNIPLLTIPGPGVTFESQFGTYRGVYRLDVPRCLSVTNGGGGNTITVTIYGFDEWDQLMEENLTIPSGNTRTGNKAFYRILKAWNNTPINPLFPVTPLTMGVTNQLGLPYCFNSTADLVNIQATITPPALNAGEVTLTNGVSPFIPLASGNWPEDLPFVDITPLYTGSAGSICIYSVEYDTTFDSSGFTIHSNNANDTSRIRWRVPTEISTYTNIIGSIPADIGPATATTGDVRGLIAVPEFIDTQPVFDGTKRILFCYYLRVATGDFQTMAKYIGVQYFKGEHL